MSGLLVVAAAVMVARLLRQGDEALESKRTVVPSIAGADATVMRIGDAANSDSGRFALWS